MTLDEAIKHAEEVAEENNKRAEHIRDKMTSEIALSNATECETCADEHRQLAEWLKDYKRLLEQPTSEDCVSRAELKKWLDTNFSFGGALRKLEMFDRIDKELPSVTPAHCIAAVRFSKEDLRDICNELIEVECTHGTCRECKNGFQTSFCSSSIYGCEIHKGTYKYNFYCADFEKRGDEDGSN